MKAYVFGEVLFDVYPHQSVIGGAPFNFSAHLGYCGVTAELISAIGSDPLGDAAKAEMVQHHIGTTYLSCVPYPTGVCQVGVTDGKPCYDLKTGQAYDNIPLTDQSLQKIAAEQEKLLYFGTLALRNQTSRQSLLRLLQRCSWNEILFDINIRQHYYDRTTLELGLSHCTVLKLSREEAPVLAQLGITLSPSLLPLCKILTHRYPNIHTVLLTLDADGAVVYDAKNDRYTPSSVPHGAVISTVGAGDSFFAGYVAGRLNGASVPQALENAVALSSYVVGHLEAVPPYDDALLRQLQKI